MCLGAGHPTPAGFTVPLLLIVPAMTEIRRVHLPVVRTLPASPVASCALSAACLNAGATAKNSRWKCVLVPNQLLSAFFGPRVCCNSLEYSSNVPTGFDLDHPLPIHQTSSVPQPSNEGSFIVLATLFCRMLTNTIQGSWPR